jgi:hypothetical protein
MQRNVKRGNTVLPESIHPSLKADRSWVSAEWMALPHMGLTLFFIIRTVMKSSNEVFVLPYFCDANHDLRKTVHGAIYPGKCLPFIALTYKKRSILRVSGTCVDHLRGHSIETRG